MKVKKLKFEGGRYSIWQANSPIGTYTACYADADKWFALWDQNRRIGDGKDRADAEAICQEHFERTVKACLEDE